MNRNRSLVLMIVAVMIVVLATPTLARPGGVVDSNQQVGCGTSCHSPGTATISMGGSPLNPQPGQQVTVWVNVTGSVSGSRLGVMIASSLTAASTQPSADGWSIVSDPSGTTFNFVERTSTSSGQQNYVWTLMAPLGGTHTLYSRAYYPGASYSTYAQGLTFIVGGGVGPGNTTVAITSPAAGTSVSRTVDIKADITDPSGISYAVLRIDGTVISNLSASPYAWSWATSQYPDGSHTINITAAGANGSFGYAQETIVVANAGVQTLDRNAWEWTAMALLLSTIAIVSVLLVILLMVKKRGPGGEG